jgi:hypothetical protein
MSKKILEEKDMPKEILEEARARPTLMICSVPEDIIIPLGTEKNTKILGE